MLCVSEKKKRLNGLIFPSYFIFHIILCGYCISNLCISKGLESRFLAFEYKNKVSTTKIAKKYLNFIEVIMPLIYYYYTVYSKLYKHYRVNRVLK